MTLAELVRDKEFKPINETKIDNKKRVSLGCKAIPVGQSYIVYVNEIGQIILDPLERIPRRELWLHKNKKALASVMKGIKQAAQGELLNSKEDYKKYLDENA
jgi:hypothetical protein